MDTEMMAVKEEVGKKKKYEEWEVEGALTTLERAEEIRENEELMKLVHKFAKKKIKNIRSIADLKKAANQITEEEQ